MRIYLNTFFFVKIIFIILYDYDYFEIFIARETRDPGNSVRFPRYLLIAFVTQTVELF